MIFGDDLAMNVTQAVTERDHLFSYPPEPMLCLERNRQYEAYILIPIPMVNMLEAKDER
jgi:hypothetical protein